MSLSYMSRTVSNVYTYPLNTKLMIKKSVETHDKKPKKTKELLYVDHYYLNG